MVSPIDPSTLISSGISSSNLIVGNEEALGKVDDAILHQGNGQKFVFELPKEIPTVSPTDNATGTSAISSLGPQSTSFGHLAQELVRDVNNYQQVAGKKVRDVLMGGKTSVHEAMVAVQESTVAFDLLAEVRNKLIDSYQELNRMQI